MADLGRDLLVLQAIHAIHRSIAVEKLANQRDEKLFSFAMRHMPASRYDFRLGRAGHERGDAPGVTGRAVFVVLTVNGKHGAFHTGEIGVEVPVREFRCEPGFGPFSPWYFFSLSISPGSAKARSASRMPASVHSSIKA